MADILLIGVSRDAPRTGALAARFQKAGLSIGDLFSEDPALHLAAAGVLVWSEASQHSLFFRDAASRLSRGGAAIVANLTNVPPPAYFASSLSFDLSRWQGDPNDPALDPLVVSTRQIIVKDLCAQAECWRALRRSRDPKPFHDYLARYGPDGAFSPLVHSRLEQLALQQRARLRAPNTAFVLAPVAESASTLDKLSPAAPHARSASTGPHARLASAAPRATPAPARTSPAAAPSPASGADARTPRPREAPPIRSRRSRMMLPLLIGAALVGSAYFGALGVSKYVFGPTESIAAPTDAPVLYLDERAPPAPSDGRLPDPSPVQVSHRVDQGSTVHAGGPLVTSPNSLPSTLALHSAPARAAPESALELAAAPTEIVEPELAHDDGGVDATAPVLELDAPASPEGAASSDPATQDVEPIVLDSLYGPQP